MGLEMQKLIFSLFCLGVGLTKKEVIDERTAADRVTMKFQVTLMYSITRCIRNHL